MPSKHLLEHCHRPNTRSSLQQRNNLGVKDLGQGIGASPLARRLLLRWKSQILFDAIGRGHAESRARGRLDGPSVRLYCKRSIIDALFVRG
jgi:hypothetical protein